MRRLHGQNLLPRLRELPRDEAAWHKGNSQPSSRLHPDIDFRPVMAASDVKDLDAHELERVGQAIHASQMDPERRKQVEKTLKRKLDLRCSIFVLMYIMNYLDRNNLGAARLKGLEADLRLDGTQYATCLSIRKYTTFAVSRAESQG